MRLSLLAERLEQTLLPLVLLSAALGLLWAAPARGAVRHSGITIALVVLVAAVGLGLPAGFLAGAGDRAGRVALAIAVPTGALPLSAWAASRIVQPGPLRLGVVSAGVAPSEIASVALATMAGGSAALAVAVLVGSTTMSVLLAGPILHLVSGASTSFSSVSLLVSLLLIVALPLAGAVVVRSRLSVARRHDAATAGSIGASSAVVVLIWLVAGDAHLDLGYVRAGLALVLYVGASTAVAAACSAGMSGPSRVSVGLPVAMRDFAIAAGIASHAFGTPAAAPLGIYGVLVLVLGATSARLSATRDRRTLGA